MSQQTHQEYLPPTHNLQQLPCFLCGLPNCIHRYVDQVIDANNRTILPFVDYRSICKMVVYPPHLEFVAREFQASYEAAVKEWHYVDGTKIAGANIVVLSPGLMLSNRATLYELGGSSVDPPTCFPQGNRRRIHFGFENMWNLREPVFLVNSKGEAKIWWQPKGCDPFTERAPELCMYLPSAFSPAKFLERLVTLFGPFPQVWPTYDPLDAATTWCACLTRANDDEVYFRVHNKRPQMAYNGTTIGMYDAVGLLQLLLGPPGDELYVDRNGVVPAAFVPVSASQPDLAAGPGPVFFGPPRPPTGPASIPYVPHPQGYEESIAAARGGRPVRPARSSPAVGFFGSGSGSGSSVGGPSMSPAPAPSSVDSLSSASARPSPAGASDVPVVSATNAALAARFMASPPAGARGVGKVPMNPFDGEDESDVEVDEAITGALRAMQFGTTLEKGKEE